MIGSLCLNDHRKDNECEEWHDPQDACHYELEMDLGVRVMKQEGRFRQATFSTKGLKHHFEETKESALSWLPLFFCFYI